MNNKHQNKQKRTPAVFGNNSLPDDKSWYERLSNWVHNVTNMTKFNLFYNVFILKWYMWIAIYMFFIFYGTTANN